MHVYELTHREDKYDLRYRLKEKVRIPSRSSTPLPTTPLSCEYPEGRGEGAQIDGSKGENHDAKGQTTTSGVPNASGLPWSRSGEDGDSFLLVTWSHVILCKGRILQLYDFSGAKVHISALKFVCDGSYTQDSKYRKNSSFSGSFCFPRVPNGKPFLSNRLTAPVNRYSSDGNW